MPQYIMDTIIKENNDIYQGDKFYAVLIDAENVSDKFAYGIFDEIYKYGIPSVKRIYGDWSSSRLKRWKELLHPLALTPIQQFGYTKAKNAADIALIIDAMDLLYTQSLYGFCIVSSDSDFTKLITRLKESAKHVIGMGEGKTPPPSVNSCNKFIYLENTLSEEDESPEQPRQHIHRKIKPLDKKTKKFIKRTIENIGNEDGWAYLSSVGKLLNDNQPDFDPRNYGCNKLNEVLRFMNKDFEIKKDEDGKTYIIKTK